MKTLFVDCSCGVSGDMLLAGLLDLGVPIDVINTPLSLLGLDTSYSLEVTESKSFSLRGLKVLVKDKELSKKYSRWIDIRKLIKDSSLKTSLKKNILKVFEILANAEASVHGVHVNQVHFHEISSIDSIVDITGVCSAIDYLQIQSFYCNNPPAGSGVVETQHGLMPVPVPAVLELAKNHNIKLISDNNVLGELTTPTGLALLIVLADFIDNPFTFDIDSIGIGLGHRNIGRPNLLRILLLKEDRIGSLQKSCPGIILQQVVLHQAWIDDSTPEDLACLTNQLNEHGAIDVVSYPICMKKGRIGVCLTSISSLEDAEKVRNIWFSFSTTIGLRENVEWRWILPRRTGICSTRFGEVLAKQVRRPDGKLTLKIEHDELARISLEQSMSIEEVRQKIILNLDTFLSDEDWSC